MCEYWNYLNDNVLFNFAIIQLLTTAKLRSKFLCNILCQCFKLKIKVQPCESSQSHFFIINNTYDGNNNTAIFFSDEWSINGGCAFTCQYRNRSL